MGWNIWTKIDGVAGPQGPAGLDGTNGTDGVDGLPGAQGPIGLTGAAGADGTDGADGAPGLPGPAGVDGIDGAQGPQGFAGVDGTNGTNGSSAYEIWTAAGNTGTESEFLASLVGVQGEQGLSGPQGETGASGASLSLTNEDLNCESIQQLEIGTMVYNSNNSSGSLNIVTPGPDCSESPTKLFMSPQINNGSENRSYYWTFNVSESIYIYNLPEIQRSGSSSGTRLYKLQNYYESTLSADSFGDALNNSRIILFNSTDSSIFILLEPGITYVLKSGDVSNYNYPNSYSSSLPTYNESLFISIGQFKKGWGSSSYEATTRWGLGVAGQMEGFSYSNPGKIFQTIVNW